MGGRFAQYRFFIVRWFGQMSVVWSKKCFTWNSFCSIFLRLPAVSVFCALIGGCKIQTKCRFSAQPIWIRGFHFALCIFLAMNVRRKVLRFHFALFRIWNILYFYMTFSGKMGRWFTELFYCITKYHTAFVYESFLQQMGRRYAPSSFGLFVLHNTIKKQFERQQPADVQTAFLGLKIFHVKHF